MQTGSITVKNEKKWNLKFVASIQWLVPGSNKVDTLSVCCNEEKKAVRDMILKMKLNHGVKMSFTVNE